MNLIRSCLVTPFGSTEQVGMAAINVSASGANVVVAPQVGYAVIVLGFVIIASGAVEIAFMDSDGTVLSGPYDIVTSGGMVASHTNIGQFITPLSGKGLNILLGGAVQVGGHITFGLIPKG